jgi:Domain of unknown function (DUF5658)
MLQWLALLTLLLTGADHWTTWLCLRQPVDGWVVAEANPLAEWLFHAAGLVPGLLIDSVLTVAAIAFLLRTRHVPHLVKVAFLALAALWTALAVANNVEAITRLGLAPVAGL